MFFPDYEEIDDEFITKRRGSKSKENLPWSILNIDQTEEKIKIPSTPTTAVVQYTTEELDQLDQPQRSHRKRQESEQYPTVPPLVYGITLQESLAGTDRESEKRDSPFLDQTVLKAGDRQDQFPTQIGEVTTPLTQFTQNIMGTSVITVKPKARSTQTKTSTQQMPIQPDFYLPDGRGSRLSEVHQIKTTEKSPEGHPAVLIVLENLRTKYNTKYFLLDRYSGHLYATGGEVLSSEPIEEKGWIYPTESTKSIAGALDEFRLTPYHTLQASTIKGTPVAESTRVPMATSTVEKTKEQVSLEKQDKVAIEKEPEQQVKDEQWEFIRFEVEKMKEAREIAQKEQQELKIEQQRIKEQKAKLEAEEEQRLQAQREKTQDSILRAKTGLEELQDKLASVHKATQQEEGGQLTESIKLSGPLDQRIEEVLKAKDETPSLISYPSSESLQEFKSDEINAEQYWYYAVKAEQIKKKMDQATRAFHERDEYHKDPKLYDSLYAEYTKQVERFQHQLKVINKILSTQKTDTGMYEYPSSPSLVLHLGELDDKPKEYFEKTKKEVSRKNSLAKRVHQHKIQNVNTSDDEGEVEKEYRRFKRKQNRVSSICDKKIQEFEEQDYLSLKGPKSVSDPIKEEEIKVQYVKPIGGNTIPPEYSKEISRYQPSEKERIRAMKDALSAVRQFTSEGNSGKNGKLNTATMKEMWDYESREPFSSKIEKAPEKSRGSQVKSSDECELCGGNHKVEQCPHEKRFSLGTDTTSSDSKEKLPDRKSRSVDYPKTQRRRPTIWRPAQSVNGITNLVKLNHTRGTLTPENLLELDPRKDQLGVEYEQTPLDSKTKAWVDEQNRMGKEKTLGHDRSRREIKDTPQPTRALQEFVKHIADPLVNKG